MKINIKTFITAPLALVAVAGQGQNQDLENLFQKYRNNPAIEYVNLLDSFPDAQRVKVAETFEFGDSLSLIRHFVEEYEQIKNFKKMKASAHKDLRNTFHRGKKPFLLHRDQTPLGT